MELTEHARRNQAAWDIKAPEYEARGRRAWSTDEPSWGIWSVPEAELRVLGDLGDLPGLDVVELGCGTAYWSAWLARRGARPVGVDITEQQLASARLFMAEFGPEFPLIQASAEAVPLPDATFDLAFSEYGASLWAAPNLWLPEASRLLRGGGRLVFLTNHAIAVLCFPEEGEATECLQRPYFGWHRFEWPNENDAVAFHLSHGDWIQLLGRNGFVVERLVEVQAPEGAPANDFDIASPGWARKWPTEEIWVARKR
jgi:SAM-dependent methyltransferase